MSVTITLESVSVPRGWKVNFSDNRVEVNYVLLDEYGVSWKSGVAYFWRDTPTDIEGNAIDPLPDNFFILSSETFDNLLAAHQAMKTDMETRFLTE